MVRCDGAAAKASPVEGTGARAAAVAEQSPRHAAELFRSADHSIHDVEWPALHFFVYPSHVGTNDAQEEEIHAGQKHDRHDQGREPLWALLQDELGVDGPGYV